MERSFVLMALFVIILALTFYFLPTYVAGGVCRSKARMEGKTIIITGASSGIGKETVLDLAKRGARVIMACRNLTKGEDVRNDIIKKTGSSNVVLRPLDLASMKSIREFSETILETEGRLDVLINNAGVAYFSELTKTEDGFEMTMGVNHLGHFLLTNLLLDLLKKSAPSRIVVVSSKAHSTVLCQGSMKLDNINSEKGYERVGAYCQSKLANILFTRELARRLDGTGVTVNALHPGVIFTGFTVNLPNIVVTAGWLVIGPFCKTAEQGAQTTLHLAVSEEVEGISGKYFIDCEIKEPSKAAQDDIVANKLWDISAKLLGLGTTVQND